MRSTKLTLLGAVFLVSSPLFASTYFGGFEDTLRGDMDYQDLVFSISGSTLTLNSQTGTWFNASAAGTLNAGRGMRTGVETPFWNNPSYDGAGGYNVGWCIYGGGACNGGVGLAPNDQYLATAGGGAVNDVTFSLSGAATEQVFLSVTVLPNTLGWALASGGPVHLFGSGLQGPLSFSPGGDFVLVGLTGIGTSYSSNVTSPDGVSHFAFFGPSGSGTSVGPTVPEPSSVGLLGLCLMTGGLAFRKRFSA